MGLHVELRQQSIHSPLGLVLSASASHGHYTPSHLSTVAALGSYLFFPSLFFGGIAGEARKKNSPRGGVLIVEWGNNDSPI